MIRINLIVYLSFIAVLINGSIGRKQTKPEPNVELKMRWKDLSLKTICEEEEWKAQFEPVREKFTKCLGLKKIIVDENDPDDDIDRMAMFRSESHNPYCKIAKTWDACTHYIEKLNCIEPNSEELMRNHRQGIAEMLDDGKHYDPENMNSMARPYKMQCEMAKFAYNYNPFGPHGYGMDYMGDYNVPNDMDVDGMPHL